MFTTNKWVERILELLRKVAKWDGVMKQGSNTGGAICDMIKRNESDVANIDFEL